MDPLSRPHFQTWVELLTFRAKTQPDRLAIRFLENGEDETSTLTYSQFHHKAQLLGSILAATAEAGQRATILLPNDPSFLIALFGCFYARVIGVPAYPPRANRNRDRVLKILKQSDSRVIIGNNNTTTAELREWLSDENFKNIRYINLDEIDWNQSTDWRSTGVQSDDIAFLQYTSGSTSDPKGVVLTHSNLLANMEMITRAMRFTPQTVVVHWLPLYHDMGLIGCTMEPLFIGCPVTIIPPAAFLQKPLRWLQAVSKYTATLTGAPNFAYDLCVKRARAEELAGLDLSSLEVMFNGAEPIRPSTLDEFAQTFAPYGFNANRMFPCYGLAEATLFVSGGPMFRGKHTRFLHKTELERGSVIAAEGKDAIELASSGAIAQGLDIKIVDPETNQILPDNKVGEILVSGPSIASAFWENPDASSSTFNLTLPGCGSRQYMKTGDLGFLDDREVYVTGRLKDLVIISGRNYYPQDIELSAQKAAPAIAIAAAFAVPGGASEKLVIVADVERTKLRSNLDEAAQAIASGVAQDHEVMVSRVIFLKPGGLPRTSSGKVQRRLTRQMLNDGNLEVVLDWSPTGGASLAQSSVSTAQNSSVGHLKQWLRDFSANRLDITLAHKRKTFAPHIVLELANKGFLGMVIPKSQGGLGLTHLELAEVVEQLGAIDLSLGLFLGINNVLGCYPLVISDNKQLQAELLSDLAQGKKLACFALTEEGAGSNPRAIVAKAERHADGRIVINGDKLWIGLASWSSVMNVFCKEYDVNGNSLGISCFSVNSNQEGVSFGPEAMTMGAQPVVQSPIALKNVVVSDAQRLGAPGKGMHIGNAAMNLARFGLCSVALGAMKRCYQITEVYASNREINTGRMSENGYVAHKLTEMQAAISALSNLVQHVGGLLDRGEQVSEELYMACKIAGPELCWEVVDQTMQLLGGRGYLEANLVPQIMRDSRLLRIFEGPTETLSYHLGSIVWRSSSANLFGKIPQAHSKIDEDLQKVKALLPTGDTQKWEQLAFCGSGMLATLSVLEALSRQAGQNDVAAWVHRRYKTALADLTETLKTSPQLSATMNRAVAEQYYTDVGYLIPTQYDEDWAVDNSLKQASKSSFGPVVLKANAVSQPQPKPETVKVEPVKVETPKVAPPEVEIAPVPRDAVAAQSVIEPQSDDTQQINDYMRKLIVKLRPGLTVQIQDTTPFAALGVDSLAAAEMLVALEEHFKISLPENLVWDYPTIQQASRIIQERLKKS